MIFHCSKKVNISYHPVGIFLYCQTCRHQYQQLSKTAFVCNDKATIVYQAMMGSCNNFKGQNAIKRLYLTRVREAATYTSHKGICSTWSIRLAYSTSGFKSFWVSFPDHRIYQITWNVQSM